MPCVNSKIEAENYLRFQDFRMELPLPYPSYPFRQATILTKQLLPFPHSPNKWEPD